MFLKLLQGGTGEQTQRQPCFTRHTRFIIDFGSLFYGSATKTRLSKIDKLQYKALRIVTGACKSTPVQALLVECGEFPLELRRSYLSKKFIIKNRYFNNEHLINKVSELASQNYSDFCLSQKRENKIWRHLTLDYEYQQICKYYLNPD